MLISTWDSLRKAPKVFRQPIKKIGGSFVICGSGPSLDLSIETVRTLSTTHYIVACASNYSTLRAANIRVDYFCLLERGSILYHDDYEPVVRKYGSCNARLIASSTTDARLHDLFPNSCIYFRPALTPLSVFSDKFNEVLNYEGPQTINTGLALVVALHDEVVLFESILCQGSRKY